MGACGSPGSAPPQATDKGALETGHAPALAGSPDQPEGHRRMVRMLAEIAKQAVVDNPFLGQAQIPRARADLASMPRSEVAKRWFLNMYLGKNELRLGHHDVAVEHYLEAIRLLGESTEAAPPEDKRVQTLFETAVAFLHLGEIRNNLARPNEDTCIFPIRGGGVHVDPEGSLRALDLLRQVLEATELPNPMNLRARWLFNLASMNLGRYPDGVPPQYRIPPDRLRSDEPFPRFVNIARRLGLDTFDLAGGAIVEDFDGDGLLDIMVSTSDTSGQMRLFASDGDGSFSDRTVEAGLEGLFGGLNLTDADYDNDGDVDVYVLRGGWFRQFGRHPNSLLRNNGDGTFTDVTFDAGLGEVRYPTQTGAWADYDNDGDLDLYVGNESGKAFKLENQPDEETQMPSQLFRNQGDGTFADVAAQAGVENLRYAKGVAWGDYDGDRFPDIYVSNAGHMNRLYNNNRDGTFTDVARELGVTRPIASFPVWFWDWNNDGILDLFVAAYGGPNLPPDVMSIAGDCLGVSVGGELARLYVGNGRGGFRDEALERGLGKVTLPMGANFGDLDNDGYPDFYLGTGYPYYDGLIPNVMFHNRRGRAFADVTTAGGFGHLQKGHGVAFADLDNDGDQDVFEQMGGAYPGDGFGNVLFENPGFGMHWIKIRLVGVRSNRFGVGSRIRIDVVEDGAPRSIYRWVGTGGSFGVNPLRQEIGVGQAERIERIDVYWPTSDETQSFRSVAVDQWIEITEGSSEYRRRPLRRWAFAR